AGVSGHTEPTAEGAAFVASRAANAVWHDGVVRLTRLGARHRGSFGQAMRSPRTYKGLMMRRRTFALGSAALFAPAVLGWTSPSVAQAQAPASPGTAVPPAAPKPGSADAIADRVQAFYDQAKTYKAKFKQRFTIYAYNRTKDSSGEVIFAKPGKMRWTYTNNGNEVVSDGKQIKIYEKENKQMYLQQVDKTQYPAAL